MNNDLISRSALIEDLQGTIDWEQGFGGFGIGMPFRMAIARLECAPAVDAEPVRHGRWVLINKEISACSECSIMRNIRTQFAWDYCPNCGAKMDGELDEID